MSGLGIDKIEVVLNGVNAGVEEVKSLLGDGFQPVQDLEKAYQDFVDPNGKFGTAIKAALAARNEALEQVKDIDWKEAIQLVVFEGFAVAEIIGKK